MNKDKPIEVGSCECCSHRPICSIRVDKKKILDYLTLSRVNKANHPFKCSLTCTHFSINEVE